MSSDAGRFAVYFAPDPESTLGRFGRHWLGYDAATGVKLPQPVLARFVPERLAAITEDARHYGFHATLKPPFFLADGCTPAALERAAVDFAARRVPFLASPPTLASISEFWALTFAQRCPAMERLAADCVEHFDPFRAAPSENELAKRRRAGLSPAQDALLVRWGYPYVMEEFRFHLTLSARLDPSEGEVLRRELTPLVAPLCHDSLAVDAICLFHQPAPQSPFRELRRFRFGGSG